MQLSEGFLRKTVPDLMIVSPELALEDIIKEALSQLNKWLGCYFNIISNE